MKGRRPSPRSPMSQFWWCQIDSNYLFGLMRPKSAPCGVTKYGGRYVNRTHYFSVLWSCSPSPYHPGHRPILFDASYIAITGNGCYTSYSKCLLVTLCNLPLCTLRREFVEQGHLLVCLAPVGLLVPTLENPSFQSRIRFRYSQQPTVGIC